MKKIILSVLIASFLSSAGVYADTVRTKLAELNFETFDDDTNYIDFSLKNLEGRTVNLRDYEGKIVFLNFWATWCPPCVKEMPSMENLYREMEGLDFEMIAVNIQERESAVKRFVQSRDLSFPVVLDTEAAAAASYRIRSIPTTYVIDKKGKVAGIFIGAKDWDSENSLRVFREISR